MPKPAGRRRALTAALVALAIAAGVFLFFAGVVVVSELHAAERQAAAAERQAAATERQAAATEARSEEVRSQEQRAPGDYFPNAVHGMKESQWGVRPKSRPESTRRVRCLGDDETDDPLCGLLDGL